MVEVTVLFFLFAELELLVVRDDRVGTGGTLPLLAAGSELFLDSIEDNILLLSSMDETLDGVLTLLFIN